MLSLSTHVSIFSRSRGLYRGSPGFSVQKRGYLTEMNVKQKSLYDWIVQQPKVELHRHLEGAIPFATLHKFYQHQANRPAFRHMKPRYATVEELRADVGLVTPMKDLAEVLDRLEAFQHSFVSVAATREITLAALLHAYHEEHIRHIEFRFSPEYMAQPFNLDWDAMFAAMLEAKAACQALVGTDYRIGFIAIAPRNYGLSSAMQTIKFAEKWKKELVGFDLAASETEFPTAEFIPAIQRAKELGLGITVHTGEGVSDQFIDKAISLYQPDRLGHATSLIHNPELLAKYLKSGVPVCINTDDPMLFDTDLNLEWLYAMDQMGATQADMKLLNENARKHSFIQ